MAVSGTTGWTRGGEAMTGVNIACGTNIIGITEAKIGKACTMTRAREGTKGIKARIIKFK